jgi:outer membrane protein assembly factor BamB
MACSTRMRGALAALLLAALLAACENSPAEPPTPAPAIAPPTPAAAAPTAGPPTVTPVPLAPGGSPRPLPPTAMPTQAAATPSAGAPAAPVTPAKTVLATADCPGAAGPDTRLPRQRRGVNIIAAAPALYGRLLDQAKDLNADWVRVQLRWSDMEPQRGDYRWETLDALADGAQARGLRLLVALGGSPAWATASGTGGLPDNPADLGAFAGALAQHAGGRVTAYEIWPALNTAAANGGRVAEPARYVAALQAAYGAIKAAQPCALVLSGALVPTLEHDPARIVDDLAYYRTLLKQGDAFRSSHDIVAIQINTGGMPGKGKWDGRSPRQARGFAGYVPMFRDEMLASEEGNKQIWVVQAGYALSGEQAVAPDKQGPYLAQLFEYLRTVAPMVSAVFVRGLESSAPDADYALIDASGAPRPGYAALRDYFRQRRGEDMRDRQIKGTGLVQLWRYAPSSEPMGRLVVAPDGAVSVGSRNGYVRTIEANGASRSVVKPGSKRIPGLAVDAAGQVYGTSHTGMLQAFTRAGAPRWATSIDGIATTILLISSDGQALYTGTDRGKLDAYAASDGHKLWSVALGGHAGDPAIGQDGTLFVGVDNGRVLAVGPDGRIVWEAQAGGPVRLAPEPAADALYVATDNGKLLALDLSGRPRWTTELGAQPRGLDLGADGAIMLTASDGTLRAVGADGQLRWSTPLGGDQLTAPAVLADGRIAVGGADEQLRIVAQNGTLQGGIDLGEPIQSAPAAGPEGALYVALGGRHNEVLAFGGPVLQARYNVP